VGRICVRPSATGSAKHTLNGSSRGELRAGDLAGGTTARRDNALHRHHAEPALGIERGSTYAVLRCGCWPSAGKASRREQFLAAAQLELAIGLLLKLFEHRDRVAIAAAEEIGLSRRTLQRAARELGIREVHRAGTRCCL